MPRCLRLTALGLGLALAGLVAAGCSDSPVGGGDEEGRSARVGETFVAQLSSEIEGRPSSVVVPGRRYDVIVASPADEIDSVTAREEGIRRRAADGTRFVAVSWDLSAAGGDALVLSGDGPDASPELALVAGGETIEVGALDEEGVFGRWVVVPADAGDDIGVAVTYDGLTQTDPDAYSDLDRAEGGSPLLYAAEQGGLHEPACPVPEEDAEPATYLIGGCDVQVSDPFPYHRQLGWADDGRAWVAARMTVDPIVVGWDESGPGGAIVDYEVEPTDVEVTLDGEAPVEVFPSEPDDPAGLQDDGSWKGVAVFAVAVDVDQVELAFTKGYVGRPEDPDEAAAEGTPDELPGTYAVTLPIDVG